MKKCIAMFFGICFAFGCSINPETNTMENMLEADKQNTSAFLTKIPSKFKGTIGAHICDSIAIKVDLRSSEKQFMLTLKYMGIGKDKHDSLNYENGKWQINGANELNLVGESIDPEFSNYKIMSEEKIILLDSSGSEKTDGKNYTLTLIKDSIAVN